MWFTKHIAEIAKSKTLVQLRKSQLRNYKSHTKNNVKSCKIVRHFIEECKGVPNLGLIIVDVLNNVGHFSSDEIEDLLLQKQQFWIGTLVTQRKGLNWDL